MTTDLRSLDVRHIDKDDARAIVLPNHYSGTWNTLFGLVNFGVFDGEELCGAAVFGYPMNPASAASIADLPEGAIVELNRLWIDDRFGQNTETAMLSRCFRWLRANTKVQLVQSFADGRLGVGTIYKAANFGYYGRERTEFYRVRSTGETLHPTRANNTANLRTMIRTNEMLVDGLLETFAVYTYRYLYPLNRYARRSIRLTPQPYPAYHRGEVAARGNTPLGQIARCYAACEAMGDPRAQKFLDYLAAEAPPEQIERLIDEAEENTWIAQAAAEAYAQPSLFGEATA